MTNIERTAQVGTQLVATLFRLGGPYQKKLPLYVQELGEDKVPFAEYTCKEEFKKAVRILMPKGYWNGWEWEDDDTTLVLKYADGTGRFISAGDVVGKLDLEQIVAGYISDSCGYTYYGVDCEIVQDEEYDSYSLELDYN